MDLSIAYLTLASKVEGWITNNFLDKLEHLGDNIYIFPNNIFDPQYMCFKQTKLDTVSKSFTEWGISTLNTL